MAEPAPVANAPIRRSLTAPVKETTATVAPAPAPKATEPAIEAKASGSAAVSVAPSTAAQRGPPSSRMPVHPPETVTRQDEPVDRTPIGTAPAVATPGEDVAKAAAEP